MGWKKTIRALLPTIIHLVDIIFHVWLNAVFRIFSASPYWRFIFITVCAVLGPVRMCAAWESLLFRLLLLRFAWSWICSTSFCLISMPPYSFLWIHWPACTLLYGPISLHYRYDCSWLPTSMCTCTLKPLWFLYFCKWDHTHRPILRLLSVWNKINFYIPSMFIRVIVSSIRPTLRISSSLVLALILGPPLTYKSQAFPFESKMKSNPYNSKDCGQLVTSFWTASNDRIIHRWISWKALLVISIPILENMNFLSSSKNHLPPILFT